MMLFRIFGSLRPMAAGLAALALTLAGEMAQGQTTVLSSPVGVMSERLPRGVSGLALPLMARDVFVGIAESNTASAVSFAAADVGMGAYLSSGVRYYLEVVKGPLEGERFDVDTEATIASGDCTVVLALGPRSFSTLAALPENALVGARLALRPHLTLATLQQMLVPGLRGSDHAMLADGVLLYEQGGFERYSLLRDGVTWHKRGSAIDCRDKVLPPDQSLLLEIRSGWHGWVHVGAVRTNAFRKNLVPGLQSFATGFPMDLAPAAIGAFVDPAAPEERRWTGSNAFGHADQILKVYEHERPFELYYLRGDGVTWRALGSRLDAAGRPILGATEMLLVRRVKPDPTYSIPRPFGL